MFLHLDTTAEEAFFGALPRPILVLKRPQALHRMFRTIPPTLACLYPLAEYSAGSNGVGDGGGAFGCLTGGGGISTGTWDGDGG